MMRKLYFLLLCILLTGCGIRDSAIVFSLEETAEESLEVSQMTAQEESAVEPVSIYVYVCGAVESPGVYELPEDARVNDALQAAGGFGEDAVTEYMNLAARVTDGEKLYFPTAEEAETLLREERENQQGLVNINTAGVSQLMELPGIGESRAQDIIAYREEHGDFLTAEDLMKVPGIKENMYGKLCHKIVVK